MRIGVSLEIVVRLFLSLFADLSFPLLSNISVVVPIDKLSMLVTIAFSWIVFHEKLTKKAAAGVLLITAGTVLLAII